MTWKKNEIGLYVPENNVIMFSVPADHELITDWENKRLISTLGPFKEKIYEKGAFNFRGMNDYELLLDKERGLYRLRLACESSKGKNTGISLLFITHVAGEGGNYDDALSIGRYASKHIPTIAKDVSDHLIDFLSPQYSGHVDEPLVQQIRKDWIDMQAQTSQFFYECFSDFVLSSADFTESQRTDLTSIVKNLDTGKPFLLSRNIPLKAKNLIRQISFNKIDKL